MSLADRITARPSRLWMKKTTRAGAYSTPLKDGFEGLRVRMPAKTEGGCKRRQQADKLKC